MSLNWQIPTGCLLCIWIALNTGNTHKFQPWSSFYLDTAGRRSRKRKKERKKLDYCQEAQASQVEALTWG